MPNIGFVNKELPVITMELKQFFLHRRSLHFVPLLFVGVFLMAWIYPVGSPIAPIIIIVLLGSELQFNNIFYRTPNELEAMLQFPISWEKIILAKNVATIILVMILLVIMTMALLYFSPDDISADKVLSAFLYFTTIIFPLLHFGNVQSVQRPRRESGLLLDDVIEATWMIVNLFLVSIPAYIVMAMLEVPYLCLVYGAVTAIYWYRVSIPKTAKRLAKEQMSICNLS